MINFKDESIRTLSVLKNKVRLALILVSVFALSACGSNNQAASDSTVIGTDQVTGNPVDIPKDPSDGSGPPNPNHDPNARIGATCHSDDSEYICLALKYVVYNTSKGDAVISELEAIDNVTKMNKLWATCKIGFEIGRHITVEPQPYGFNFNSTTMSELDRVRAEFEDDETLLVVTTGTWAGSLGAAATNAWTAMPGSGVYGVVLEEPVANSATLIAHELGHYLNLGHVSDSSNLMNPVIYQGSTTISSSQCSAARSAAKYYWSAMYR